MNEFLTRLSRTFVSYLPSASLFPLRSLRDVPARVRQLPHEPDFAAFAAFDHRDAVILDVGANRGQSIRSLRLFAPLATIHAFEPNPILADHVAQRRHPGVHTHHCGLAATPGSMELHLPRYGHTIYDTRAGLTPEAAASFLTSEHFVRFNAARAQVVSETVEISTLDSFELEATAIKIDVEGADLDVVLGAWQTIETHRPLLMIEFPSAETTRRLGALGYEPAAFVDGALLPGGKDELNTLFVLPHHRTAIESASSPQ